MNESLRSWRRYEECRPDELAALVAESPVAIWPCGMIEHHGWHLPVGFDTIVVQRICQRLIARTGGLLLPPLWWGWGGAGGHANFLWTHYREQDATASIIRGVCEQLVSFGCRAIVVMAGHGPYHEILLGEQKGLSARFPETLFLMEVEASIGAPEVTLAIDHAALEETSLGLELLPELVVMSALRADHNPSEQWPAGITSAGEFPEYPGFNTDPTSELFGQFGADPRAASAERVHDKVEQLIAHLTRQIDAHLLR